MAEDIGAAAPAAAESTAAPVEEKVESQVDEGVEAQEEDKRTDVQKLNDKLDKTLEKAYDKISKTPDRAKDGTFKGKAHGLPSEQAAVAALNADTSESDDAPEKKAKPDKKSAKAEDESTDQPEDKKAEPAKKPAIKPPTSWSAEAKKAWEALPSEAQHYVAKREQEATKFISQLGNEKKQLEQRVKAYEPLDQVLLAHANEFKRRGVSAPQGISNLLQAQRMLDQDAVGGMMQIAGSYGISPQQLVEGILQRAQHMANAPAPAPVSPELRQAQAELQAIKKHLTVQHNQQQKAAQANYQRAETALTGQIEVYAQKKPYFKAVEGDIMDLVPVLRAKHPGANPLAVLNAAYEKAVWANPQVRERILSDQRKAEAKKAHDEQVKKAQAASKMAGVNIRGGDARKSSNNPTSWHDTLSATYDRLHGTS